MGYLSQIWVLKDKLTSLFKIKKSTMKNLLKFGFLGLALTFMVVACNEPAAQEEAQEVEVITEEDAVIEADSTDTVVVEEEVVTDSAEAN